MSTDEQLILFCFILFFFVVQGKTGYTAKTVCACAGVPGVHHHAYPESFLNNRKECHFLHMPMLQQIVFYLCLCKQP